MNNEIACLPLIPVRFGTPPSLCRRIQPTYSEIFDRYPQSIWFGNLGPKQDWNVWVRHSPEQKPYILACLQIEWKQNWNLFETKGFSGKYQVGFTIAQWQQESEKIRQIASKWLPHYGTAPLPGAPTPFRIPFVRFLTGTHTHNMPVIVILFERNERFKYRVFTTNLSLIRCHTRAERASRERAKRNGEREREAQLNQFDSETDRMEYKIPGLFPCRCLFVCASAFGYQVHFFVEAAVDDFSHRNAAMPSAVSYVNWNANRRGLRGCGVGRRLEWAAEKHNIDHRYIDFMMEFMQ